VPRRDVLLIRSPEVGWAELASVLAAIAGVRVVADVSCPHQGGGLAAALRPDVILTAARIGELAVPRVLLGVQRGPCPAAKIAFFSSGVDPDLLAATAGLRYDAWLLWPEVTAEGLPHLLQAILFAEGRVGSPSVVAALLAAGRRLEPDDAAAAGGSVRLACREREVLALLALDGEAELTLAEIARSLHIKTCSVDTYVDRLAAKLGVERGGRRAVVAAARRAGVLP